MTFEGGPTSNASAGLPALSSWLPSKNGSAKSERNDPSSHAGVPLVMVLNAGTACHRVSELRRSRSTDLENYHKICPNAFNGFSRAGAEGLFPAGAIPRAPRRSLLPLAQPKPRPATTRLLHMPRSQSVVAPWQLAALPIPPGPFTSPPLTWNPVRGFLISGRSSGRPQSNSPATARLVRAVTSPTALHA